MNLADEIEARRIAKKNKTQVCQNCIVVCKPIDKGGCQKWLEAPKDPNRIIVS